MVRRVTSVVEKLVAVTQSWEAVDTVAYLHPVDDQLDPYFYLSLDIYHDGGVPGSAQRAEEIALSCMDTFVPEGMGEGDSGAGNQGSEE